MTGGSGGPNTGSGADDQDDPATPDAQQEEPDLEAEAREVASKARQKSLDDLSRIKNEMEALSFHSEEGEIFSELDEFAIEVGDHESNIQYLIWLTKHIQNRGGRWFPPPEIAAKIEKHVADMTDAYQKIHAQLGTDGKHNFDKVTIDRSGVRKETLDGLRDLIASAKEAREASRKKLIDKIDKTLLDTVEKMRKRDVMDEKKEARDAMVEAATEQIRQLRENNDPFEKQYEDRLAIAGFLKSKDTELWKSEQDKERLPALSPEGLRARMKGLREQRDELVTPYLDTIRKKRDGIRAKIRGKVRSTIESVFAGEEKKEIRQEHLERLEKIEQDLDAWDNLEFFDVALSETAHVDPAKMLDPMGRMLSNEALQDKTIGAEDWLALAEMPGVSDEIKNAALLTASDMLMAIEKTMEDPKKFATTQLDDYSLELDRYVNDLNEKGEETSGYKIYFLALYDFKHMGEKLVEWAKRKYNRRSDRLLGDFGSSLLSGLPGPLATAANEFDRLKESSEQEEVNQYKEAYSNKDAWQIIEVMHSTKNQDEMKACMYLLADLGRIRWDDPQLWSQLMYFGHGLVQFQVDDPESELRNQGRLHDKLQKIVGVIWDFDTFQAWQTTNESNYTSKMESHKDFCDKNAEMAGALDLVLSQMLADYKRDKKAGKVPKVDPQKFEKLIHYNIEFGKGSPEGKLYYLIQGIACGLLSRDTASRVNSKWINAYPVIDVFGSEEEGAEKPTMEHIRRWARLDGDRNAPGKAFHRWFYTDVIHRPRVYQRVDKALTQGMGQDHDDATCWFGAMSANTAKTILSRNAQGFSMPMTGYQNATVGMLHYLDTIMEGYGKMGEDRGDERSAFNQVIRFANMFATFDGITAGRMLKNDPNHFKWNGEQYRKPRYAGFYGESYGRGDDRTTQDNIDTMRTYLSELDPVFFTFLFEESQTATDKEIQIFCKKRETHFNKNYGIKNVFGTAGIPQNADQLHQRVGEYLRNTLESAAGQTNLQRMRNRITSDHKRYDARQKEGSQRHLSVTEQMERDLSGPTEPTALGGIRVSEAEIRRMKRYYPGKK